VYKFISSNKPLEGGVTIIRMTSKEAEQEVALDRQRQLLQQQARRLHLFGYKYPYQSQNTEDADNYLHARIRTCEDGICTYTDPSPEEKQRRKTYLENVNKQFGPLWTEYFKSRPYSEKERKELTVRALSGAQAKQFIDIKRARDILSIQKKANETGISPGILLDDF
jgi:hypothetical protein